jgi:hypothetical protein
MFWARATMITAAVAKTIIKDAVDLAKKQKREEDKARLLRRSSSSLLNLFRRNSINPEEEIKPSR